MIGKEAALDAAHSLKTEDNKQYGMVGVRSILVLLIILIVLIF